jgi:type IV secretory pathway VirB3-like protein
MFPSKFENGVYYGLSRTSWVFGIFMIYLAIFAGRFQVGRAFLSNNNSRILAKALPIACVIQVLVA